MKDYEEYTEYESRKLEEGSKKVEEKILNAVQNGVKKVLSSKDKERILEDYSFWYDKYAGKKDAEFLKKEISDINNNVKSKYFNY